MPDIIDKISEWQPDPAVVGTKLKDTFTLQSEILKTLTALIKLKRQII